MPARYLILGQVAPAAASATVLYTVPAGKDAVISTIVVANRTATGTAFRIAVLPSGAATIEPQHYIAYDVSLGGADSTTLTLGITLSAGQGVRVQAISADVSFTAFGTEITF
jgi:hypothetical protein